LPACSVPWGAGTTIGAIEVLKSFMNIDKIDDHRLASTVGIHLLLMLVVAMSDRLARRHQVQG